MPRCWVVSSLVVLAVGMGVAVGGARAYLSTPLDTSNPDVASVMSAEQRGDTEPPVCTVVADPDCHGFTDNAICGHKNWTAQVVLQDLGSGLSSVHARPEGFATEVDSFTPGTLEPVGVSYSASCCTTQVDISGVDIAGNEGKCQIDMGELGGYIKNLKAADVGVTWVLLQWTITPSTFDLHKYSLLIDNDFNEEFVCSEAECTRNVTYLDPCTNHHFQLTPHFYIGENDKPAEPAYTDVTTLDSIPGEPFGGTQESSSENSVTVSWQASNFQCIAEYQVCYRAIGFASTELCERTTETSYTLRAVEACAVYEVTVTSLSPLGEHSDPHVFQVATDEAELEAPRNLDVVLAKADMVTLRWEDPVLYSRCIDRYMVTYGEAEKKSFEISRESFGARKEHLATISDLNPCTNYTFDVKAVSATGAQGPRSTRSANTLENGDPKPIETLGVDTETIDSLHVAWDSSEVCLDHYYLCYIEEGVPHEECQKVYDREITLEGLKSCTTYTVIVSLVTPSGKQSNRTYGSSKTLEVSPGVPQNLRVLKETPHTIDINYDPPIVNPQCTVEYDIEQVNLDIAGKRVLSTHPQPYLESVFLNLDACTHYEVRVRAVSKSKLKSEYTTTNATTKEDIPSSPQKFELFQASPTTLDVIWWWPENNTRCLLEYELMWTNPSGETNSMMISPTGSEPLPFEVESQITGLTACTKYELDVIALSKSGLPGVPATLSASTTGCSFS